MNKNTNFSQFTNQYELSKTLRFELKPVGNTKQMLEDENVFEKDELIQKKYIATKPYFNRLHREFVQEALSGSCLNFDEFFKIYGEWKKDKKDKNVERALAKKEKELRKEILNLFNKKAKDWFDKYSRLKPKKKNIEILFEEGVFNILKERYGNESETIIENPVTGNDESIFDSWKGFTGYFIKFQETRKNFYKDDGTSTAIATRIIDQNLRRFCDNFKIIESLKNKIDFSEVEESFGKSFEEVFDINYYNQCFLQDGIDFYNKVLGGETKANGEKLRGINEIINEYRQNNKGEKVPFLKMLDKQILSEKEKFIEGIENDEELFNTLKEFYKNSCKKVEKLKLLFVDFFNNVENYSLKDIYISKQALNTISRKWTTETEKFNETLYEAMKADKVSGLKFEKSDNSYKFPDFIALDFIKKALSALPVDEKFWKEVYYKNDSNENGFLEIEDDKWSQFLEIFRYEIDVLLNQFKENKEDFNKLVESENFTLNQSAREVIKNFADNILVIYQVAKYFALEKKRKWIDEFETGDFYENPNFGYKLFYEDAYLQIVQAYNSIRNYLTKNPYSEEKWKLNFENPTLADGWDKNKESDNSAIILKKGNKFYLGLMRKGHNKIFDDRFKEHFQKGIENGKYEKVVYKYFPDQAKMFPKVCFSAKGLEFFNPTEEIYNIYKNAEFKKGVTFSIPSMQKLIDFYKDALKKYDGWKYYNFSNLRQTSEYTENIGEFFKDVAKDGYKISFQDISDEYINEKNQNGELYFFQIYNKDFELDESIASKNYLFKARDGVKNLHTMYFEALFSNENIVKNFPIKLNGQAEIFYRPKTSVEKLGKKKDKSGKEVTDHKRYAENKTFFHVPIALNRGKGNVFKFNNKLNDFLANNEDINIIGVDRGEKHLAYYSVINQEGKILDSGTLNKVGEKGKEIDYHQKLEAKAGEREQQRKSWSEVEGIKDLKKGYISQVVRKLADLAVKHSAIIVFEDLNMRFKQIRGGIEKSVYQQLEKALIEKLNFLVNKGEKDSAKAGHLLRAYQLTAPFDTFANMGKQTGIIFYTQASYTSKIDPVTGWRPNLYLRYSNAEKAKGDILKFSNIEYNSERDRFEFAYDLKNLNNQKEYPKKTQWTACSCVQRFRWNKKLNQNKGGYDEYDNLTDNFKELFQDFNVDITQDISRQIKKLETKGNEKFFKDFIFFFNLICQIRNTDEKASDVNDQDFILSPVEPFFDSRKSKEFGENLPQNGDDNGAFNIARKGIIVLDKISKFAKENGSCEKLKWGDLYISHTDWDNFAQK